MLEIRTFIGSVFTIIGEMMERDDRLSILRSLACFAIVLLHTIFVANKMFISEITYDENLISSIIENLTMWAVPTFVMVSGALILTPKKRMTYKKLYMNYVFRMFYIIVFFAMLYNILDTVFAGNPVNPRTFLDGFLNAFRSNSWAHMWYLYMLIGLYIMLPFYRMIAKGSKTFDLKYLLGVYIVFLSLLPLVKMGDAHVEFYIHQLTIYPFYLFLGYAIYEGKIKSNFRLGLSFTALGTLAIILATFIRWQYGLEQIEQLWGYSSIFVIIQTAGIFMMATSARKKNPNFLGKFLVSFDKASFGVYLIHIIFVRYLFKYAQFNPYASGGIFAVIGIAAAVAIVSYLISAVIQRIPVLRKLV